MAHPTSSHLPALTAAPTDPAERDVSHLTFRARLRPLAVREAAEAGLIEERATEESGEEWYWFTAEVSSMALDAYYTHMADDTLRNFAREAATGVALLDSHDGYKLGVGYSAGGRYEEEDGNGRALGVFYIVPGIRFGGRHSFAGTDDYIRAIKNGAVRDVSVGFYGGRLVCDLCHQPYYGRGTTCNHVAGWEYEIERDGKMVREVCTVTIHEAHLSEVSLVYDGATPGAMILKAEQEAEAGRLSPAMVRQIERQYRIRLPRPEAADTALRFGPQVSPYLTTGSTSTIVISAQPEINGERTMTMDEETTEFVEQEIVETETAVDAAVEGESVEAERAVLTEVRQAAAESPAPRDASPAEAVRWLSRQLAQATQERDAAQQEVARLQPLADQGTAYRRQMIEETVAEGVRAMGDAFPEETYRAMLENAPLEHVRQVRDTFAGQAKARFPGGRQTSGLNGNDAQPGRPVTPAAAYGAQ